jgi:hypothetical protein
LWWWLGGMGLLFVQRLDGNGVFKCRRCRVDAASKDAIISKEFQGSSGRAYLFDHVVNICLGPNEDRYLITGLHTVNDIYCSCCQQILGWRYVSKHKLFIMNVHFSYSQLHDCQ